MAVQGISGSPLPRLAELGPARSVIASGSRSEDREESALHGTTTSLGTMLAWRGCGSRDGAGLHGILTLTSSYAFSLR